MPSREVVQRQIARNARVHDRLAANYDRAHGEIFNPVEQARLADTLKQAVEAVRSGGKPPRAIDFGCGSGNLTRHLLNFGCEVVAADVSPRSLELVRDRFKVVETVELNGTDLAPLPSCSFDVCAAYSVLHHVPDYLHAISEMARLLRPGGILYIDHEPPEYFWREDDLYRAFLSQARRRDWRKFLKPRLYVQKLRRVFQPRYTNEGDIHVWPDDHVEWGKIEASLSRLGFVRVFQFDYLLCRREYRQDVFERFRHCCADMRAAAFRKLGPYEEART